MADELHKPIKRNFTRRRFIVIVIDKIWCSDLVEMQQFSKRNKGYRYLLMVLDLFGRKPQYLWTDKNKEYYHKHMRELLEKNGITLYSTENEETSSVCERWKSVPSKSRCGRNLLSRVIPNVSVYYQKYWSSIITPNIVPLK